MRVNAPGSGAAGGGDGGTAGAASAAGPEGIAGTFHIPARVYCTSSWVARSCILSQSSKCKYGGASVITYAVPSLLPISITFVAVLGGSARRRESSFSFSGVAPGKR